MTISRRQFLSKVTIGTVGVMSASTLSCRSKQSVSLSGKKPNILFAISDDQSWIHTGISGCKVVNTPGFDRVAHEGVLFTNVFCAAPQCSPNRAATLTGRYIWQIEEAGTHASNFPLKYKVFPEILEESGYKVGYTGKPWGPGNWEISGRKRNPAGPEYNRHKVSSKPTDKISNTDYAANFQEFLGEKTNDQPFCFWFGCHEPHRAYEKGTGEKAGKKTEDVKVPPFLPDRKEIRQDILDYAVEIDWFDKHLGQMIDLLEKAGELENTMIVVTSDNGMPFPRAKANLYEYGIHMPLAIRWPERVKGGRVVHDLVSFIDYAPTFLEAAGLEPLAEMTGKSFLNTLVSDKKSPHRGHILTGRERHTHARPENFGYPSRAIRTMDYLYIRNFHPERWPAGDPTGSGDPDGYHDIDASPSKTFVIAGLTSPDMKILSEKSLAKRPLEELYDIQKDPGCLKNLATLTEFEKIKKELGARLEQLLTEQKDPRMLGYGDVFESYPRYSHMRKFPGFKEQGKYNPKYQVEKK